VFRRVIGQARGCLRCLRSAEGAVAWGSERLESSRRLRIATTSSLLVLLAAMGAAVPFAIAELSNPIVVGGTTVVTPGTTYVVPGTTIIVPGATTVAPAVTITVPGTTSVSGETTVTIPGSTTVFPGSTLVLPDSTTVSAATTVTVPGSTTVVGGTTITNPNGIAYNIVPFSTGPINAPPIINEAKAGQTVPIQFRLMVNGVPVSDPGAFESITSGSTACSPADPVDAIETYTSNAGLQYLGDGNWRFNWQTPKSYAGQCRVMRINLSSGQPGPTALFQFK
jgi:hypothetical protein